VATDILNDMLIIIPCIDTLSIDILILCCIDMPSSITMVGVIVVLGISEGAADGTMDTISVGEDVGSLVVFIDMDMDIDSSPKPRKGSNGDGAGVATALNDSSNNPAMLIDSSTTTSSAMLIESSSVMLVLILPSCKLILCTMDISSSSIVRIGGVKMGRLMLILRLIVGRLICTGSGMSKS